MSADVRMELEEELDRLDDSRVESWVQRCFEACDPRYDSDWLNGMFELALMTLPDNYEIRSAASRAATMDAQRLYEEGETAEAISRLEKLLEADPYCTEAFEMLERFMAGTSSAAPAVAAPAPSPAEAPTIEEPAPIALGVDLPDDDEISFLDGDNLLDLTPSLEPELPAAFPSGSAEPVAVEPVAVDVEPVPVEPEPEPHPVAADPVIAAPVVLEPEEVLLAEPLPFLEEAVQPELAAPPPPPPPVEVAPVMAEAIPVAAPPPPPPPPPPAPAGLNLVATSSRNFDWRSVVALPGHTPGPIEAQLEALLPAMVERFVQAGNYRSLVLVLTDLLQRDPQHKLVENQLHQCLKAWAAQLERQGRGPEAGQVAAWSRQLLSGTAEWSDAITQRFPATSLQIPDLTSLSASSAAPAWMAWVQPLRDDPARFEEAGQALASDPQAIQSLFRHLAVHHPNHPEHVLNLGWAYSFTGQHALAMVHTQRSMQMQSSPRALALLKKIYEDLGQPDMAQRVARQAG